MIRGQQGRPYEDRLRDLNLFSLHMRRLSEGDRVAIYKLVRGDQQALGKSLFPRAPPGVTRNNSHKLAEGRFRLDIRRRDFTVRAARVWNHLPSEAVLASTLGVIKRRLDEHKDNQEGNSNKLRRPVGEALGSLRAGELSVQEEWSFLKETILGANNPSKMFI